MPRIPLGDATYYSGLASAGVLGGITADLPGAALAVKAYQSRYERRKRTRPYPTPEKTPSKKPRTDISVKPRSELSMAPKKIMKARARKRTKALRTKHVKKAKLPKPPNGAGDRGLVEVSQHKKKVELKHKKVPHVTAYFRKAVEAALSPKTLKGTYHLMYCDQGLDLTTVSEDRQVPFDTINNVNYDGGMLFTVDHFNEAVQRLWMGKVTAYGSGDLDPRGNGNYSNRKFKVINSWTSFEYKNNSTRVITLKIYECAPKKYGATRIDTPYTNAYYDNLGNIVAAQKDPLYPPQKYWGDALQQDKTLGFSADGVGGFLSNTSLGLSPNSSKVFNAGWKVELKQVRMLPGETFKLRIQGPSQLELDFEKFNSDGVYQNIQKFSRGLLNIVTLDMTDLSLGGTARAPAVTTTTIKPFLSIERQDHYRFEMPDVNIPVDSRVDRYIRAYMSNGIVAGVQEEIAKRNPQAYINQ